MFLPWPSVEKSLKQQNQEILPLRRVWFQIYEICLCQDTEIPIPPMQKPGRTGHAEGRMKQITFHLAWYLAIECSGDSEGYTGYPENGRNRSKGIWDTHTEQRFSSNMNQDQVGESFHLRAGTICFFHVFFQRPRSFHTWTFPCKLWQWQFPKLSIHWTCHRAGAVHPGPSASASISLLDSSAMAPLTPSELPVRVHGLGQVATARLSSAAVAIWLRWARCQRSCPQVLWNHYHPMPGSLGSGENSVDASEIRQYNQLRWYTYVISHYLQGFKNIPTKVVCSYCW